MLRYLGDRSVSWSIVLNGGTVRDIRFPCDDVITPGGVNKCGLFVVTVKQNDEVTLALEQRFNATAIVYNPHVAYLLNTKEYGQVMERKREN